MALSTLAMLSRFRKPATTAQAPMHVEPLLIMSGKGELTASCNCASALCAAAAALFQDNAVLAAYCSRCLPLQCPLCLCLWCLLVLPMAAPPLHKYEQAAFRFTPLSAAIVALAFCNTDFAVA
jgi:hypothetical protein